MAGRLAGGWRCIVVQRPTARHPDSPSSHLSRAGPQHAPEHFTADRTRGHLQGSVHRSDTGAFRSISISVARSSGFNCSSCFPIATPYTVGVLQWVLSAPLLIDWHMESDIDTSISRIRFYFNRMMAACGSLRFLSLVKLPMNVGSTCVNSPVSPLDDSVTMPRPGQLPAAACATVVGKGPRSAT